MGIENNIKKVKIKNLQKYILKIEGPRHPIDNLDKLNDVANYILSEFESYGLNTNEQRFDLSGVEGTFRNIEGYLGDGTQPELIIISHYDTVAKSPGANDNASAVALMLESARILSQEKKKYNVRFISFTLEEGPPISHNLEEINNLSYFTIGSNYWMNRAMENKKKIKGILCFDTIAYTNKNKNSQRIPASITPRMLRSAFKTYKVDLDNLIGDFIAIIASKGSENILQSFCLQASSELVDLPHIYGKFNIGYEQLLKTLPDLLRSDHGPFWRENVPGLFLSDTADFRYPFYHTSADTFDKLDFNFLTKLTKATVATIIDLMGE